MSGRHAFDLLTKDFSPERRARVEARKSELLAARLGISTYKEQFVLKGAMLFSLWATVCRWSTRT